MRQIPRHAKDPTPKILSRFSLFQMLEQKQERFLNDLLAIVSGQTQDQQITQKAVTQLVE